MGLGVLQIATGLCLHQGEHIDRFDELLVLCLFLRRQRAVIRLLTERVDPLMS